MTLNTACAANAARYAAACGAPGSCANITNPGTTKSAPVPPAKSDRFGPHGMHVRPKLTVMLCRCALAVARNERTMDASSPGRCDPE